MAGLASILEIFGNPSPQQPLSTGDVSAQPGPLQGPGSSIEDLIPAVIEDPETGAQEPARLSPGEFVWDAGDVEQFGDGDVELGAQLLDVLRSDKDLLREVKELVKNRVLKDD